MLFQGGGGIIQLIADIIAMIITFLKPIIIPIGEWMIGWVEFLLQFFPSGWDYLGFYIVIFIILIICAVIVNCKWPGDKPIAKFEKTGRGIEDSVRICKDCGQSIGSSDICPFCGALND
ncbi:MAG: hypothetical protein ACTSQS_11765 [Promethearchaeota archaeon]